MKRIGIIILGFLILLSFEGFAQQELTRSLRQTKAIKTTSVKTGAFGEVLKVKEAKEDKKSFERHFDLAEMEDVADVAEIEMDVEESSKAADFKSIMDIMVINERNAPNQAPPVCEALSFHDAKIITNESGFYIQLVETEEILNKEHKIYQEFGNLRVETTLDSKFCYLIGSFSTKEMVDKFLTDIILPRYPEAKAIQFQEGKRL